MTVQLATERDARREVARARRRAYSGPGFGPRSFECVGLGIGIDIGIGDTAAGGAYLHPGLAVTSATPLALYDAVFNTLVSGNVSALIDQSAAGHNAVQAGTTQQPVYTAVDATLNNKPTFTTDGVNDILAAAFATAQNQYYTAVIKILGTGSYWGGPTNSGNTYLDAGPGHPQPYSGGFMSNATVSPTTAWTLVEVLYNNGAGQWRVTWNNAGGDFSTTAQSSGTAVDTSWTIGGRGGVFGSAAIANVSVFNALLSTGDRATLRAALISRYALPFS